MIACVYKSTKKTGAYLYLAADFEWDDLPDDLISIIGECEQVMALDLSTRDRLASENIETVKSNLRLQGYHLQMPPKHLTGVIKYGV